MDAMTTETVRLARIKADKAAADWNRAPVHIKGLAGEYMRPIMACLLAQQNAIEALAQGAKQ